MEIVPDRWLQNLKRYWRRRKYGEFDINHDAVHAKRKIKTTRFGSPSKEGFVVDKSTVGQILGGNEYSIPKSRPTPIVVSSTDEVVDERSVLEIYKQVVSTRELALAY
ncbi:hypothetical protein Vadar_017065 [Vaccinium darrowii]|uniref:Uncharacterized protein n=1 Tax=Vaccinium darrowii TaxID=229202 RepID=A0ACB7X1H5_9ERIC|nr:hypothetical protein Vadar_017065 [Vaccinium darrowii]